MLTFPKLATAYIRGSAQNIIEKFSARLYRYTTLNDTTTIDNFLTDSSGEMKSLDESEAEELRATIKDNPLLDIVQGTSSFEVSYVNPSHNPDGAKYQHFPVLKFHHSQIPAEYIAEFSDLVRRKSKDSTSKRIPS